MLLYGKKGYLRTIEMVIIFLLTFSLLAVIIRDPNVISEQEEKEEIISELIKDEGFREMLFNIEKRCVYSDDSELIITFLKEIIYDDFTLCINKKPSLPKKSVDVQSIFFTGTINQTITEKEVKLYIY